MFSISRNLQLLTQRPCCKAIIRGDSAHVQLHGTVSFLNAFCGTLVVTELFGLPSPNGIFAMHIHSGGSCTGTAADPFANAGAHLNLMNTEHPFHTGDLPALFSNDGYAWSTVFTSRFKPLQVKGHTVIIHAQPDDYHTQPSGNSGAKIACGVIE